MLMGGLLHLSMHTLPEDTFTALFLSLLIDAPLWGLWVTAKNILRYLVGIMEHVIIVKTFNMNEKICSRRI